MTASYILILALLGVSALSLASATKSSTPVVIKTNETGIVTLTAVNTALNKTWNIFQRSWSKGNKTTRRPVTPAPLVAFLDVDTIGLAAFPWKGVNVTLLSPEAFQVTLTRGKINPMVQYLASNTNGTNVTGIVLVIVPKSVWWKAAGADDEAVEAATFGFNKTIDWPGHNKTIDWPVKNITKPVRPVQPKPFFSMVQKRIARNESTTTVTVADINGKSNGGIVKAASLGGIRPNLATITGATATKWASATVGFDAAVSNTSFTVTVTGNKPHSWVTVAVTGVNVDNSTAQGTVSVKITRPFGKGL